MKLYISKDIEDKCGATFSRKKREKEIDEWLLDVVSINRRKTLICLNEKSGLVLLYYRIEVSDYKRLSDIFSSLLKKNLETLNIELPNAGGIEVYKGEGKREIEKVKERLLSFSEYISDDDRALLYATFLLNTEKGAAEKYSKRKDISLLFDIKELDGKKKASVLLPSYFTLESLKKTVITLFNLDADDRSDFLFFNEKGKIADIKYKREDMRFLEKELDERLKRKDCTYALMKSTMLSTTPKTLYFRSSLVDPVFFKVDLQSPMEGYNLKSPLLLSLKGEDVESLNDKLKAIKS